MGFPILVRLHLYIESGPWGPQNLIDMVTPLATHYCNQRANHSGITLPSKRTGTIELNGITHWHWPQQPASSLGRNDYYSSWRIDIMLNKTWRMAHVYVSKNKTKQTNKKKHSTRKGLIFFYFIAEMWMGHKQPPCSMCVLLIRQIFQR